MNRFKIAVLGAAGAGKTVFLASLFNRLSVQRDDTGFFVSTEAGARTRLVQTYEKLASPSLPWPPPTRRDEMPTWIFTCKVANGADIYSVLQFEYLDYAGGLFSGGTADGEGAEQVDIFAQGAISTIGILDGIKVLIELGGDSSPIMGSSLFSDLANMLNMMQAATGSVHFIVTKWDVLEAAGKTLEDVKTLLNTDGNFVEFVKNRGSLSSIRLIPVSAVGKGFAELHRSKDELAMRKIPGARPHPFQVEMPMAAVLSDSFREALALLAEDRKKLERTHQDQGLAPNYSLLDAAGRIAAKSVRGIWSFLPASFQDLGARAVERLAMGLESGAHSKEADLVAERERLKSQIGEISSHEQALDYVLGRFSNLSRTLTSRFPVSQLSKGEGEE